LTMRNQMIAVIKRDDPRITIPGLANALAKIGITLPENVTTTPQHVTVPDPDSAEIVAAIQAAAGDPAADKEVQRLITARAIARGGYLDLLEHAARKDQWKALKDALDTVNAEIHDVFDGAAR